MAAPSVIDNPSQGDGGGGVTRQYQMAGTTTGAFVTYLNFTSTNGLIGSGTIKNTGGNSLEVQETVTDFFGVTDSTTTTVLSGNDLLLSLSVNIDTSRPPYRDYLLEVRHPVAATTFDLQFSAAGA